MRRGLSTVAIVFLALSVPRSSQAMAPSDPLAIAAEYYFTRHDFRQSLTLWEGVLKRQPDNVAAVLRVAELKLMFEGRAATRETITHYLDLKGDALATEARRALREKLGQLQSTFVSDEGQALFLQALPKVRAKDCQGALPLLAQAAVLEKGSPKVLREKARCEKALGATDRLRDSLSQAAESDPYDSDILESLAETLDYAGAYDKSAALFDKEPDLARTVRQRTAYGVALAELGAAGKAIPILRGLLEQKETRVHPIVYATLGRLLAARGGSQAEATHYLERFVTAASRPENATFDGWDPYHTSEKLEPSQKLLASLKSPTSD